VSAVPLPGFADPVAGAQRTFRAVLDALARPTIPVVLGALPPAPGVMSPVAAAIALTLCDEATPVWLDPGLSAAEEVRAWFAFRTGSPVVDEPAAAAFAFASDPSALPPLDAFALGTDEAPHASTTIVLAAGGAGVPFEADGPGFPEPRDWDAPALPASFAAQWSANHARFPRGVDLLIAGEHAVTGLPRTTRLRVEA